jgi:hypothetical protein
VFNDFQEIEKLLLCVFIHDTFPKQDTGKLKQEKKKTFRIANANSSNDDEKQFDFGT